MTSSTNENNVVQFPAGDDAFECAALWLTRLERGLKDDEHEQFRELMGANPAVSKALDELSAFWGEQHLVPQFSALKSSVQQQSSPRSMFSWRSAAAAAVILTAGIGLFTYGESKSGRDAADQLVQFEQSYSTEIGEQSIKQLPDGSTVALNTGTEVHIRFQGNDRMIELVRGEAFFSVAHDVERPFGVRAGGRIVQAVGTAFNVRIQNAGEEVEVAVTDGIVRILDEDRHTEIALDEPDVPDEWWKTPSVGNNVVMGQVALFEKNSSPEFRVPEILLLQPSQMETKMAWQRGELIFEGQPLREVLEEYSRYTTTKFFLEDESLGDIRVGGYFRVGDVDGLLVTLAENFQIEAQRNPDDRVLLR